MNYTVKDGRLYDEQNNLAVLVSANEPPDMNEYAGFSANNNPRYDYLPQLPFLHKVVIYLLEYKQIDSETLRELTYKTLVELNKVPLNQETHEPFTEDEFENIGINYEGAEYLKIQWVPKGKIFRIICDDYGNDFVEVFNLKEWHTS